MTLSTKRLCLRELEQADLPALRRILQDPEVMYAYEHAFDDAEVQAWLDWQRASYRENGFGLWAVVCRRTGQMIGQCGLTWQATPQGRVLEVGYLFERAVWHQGYASEAARACRDYAFTALGAGEVFSIIRENNAPSRRVAERNGMAVTGRMIKHYYGMELPHLLYSVRADRAAENQKKESGGMEIRFAAPEDSGAILHFIQELAVYEHMTDQVVATEALLREWIFEKKKAEVLLALEDGTPVGFALFFHNFSTFLSRAGIYLEDLFVLQAYRGRGYGKALLTRLSQIAVERGCGRLEWSCLDWNAPSIQFYRGLGAESMDGWTVYRLTGDTLRRLAEG